MTKSASVNLLTTMVVNNSTLSKLMDIGLSEYEARVYTALISNNPATAYEIAGVSGIPSSKIYEVVLRLVDKGIVMVIQDGKKRYVPVDPMEFIESRRDRLETTFNNLTYELSQLKTDTDVSYIWNIHDYDYLMNRSKRMIADAGKTLMISGWKDEISGLKAELKKSQKSKVKIALVHFGEIEYEIGQVYQHPIEDTIYNEKGGRGFALVADSKEAIMGTVLTNNRVEGAWSMNTGFVTLAEDYIKHDIYIMKIVNRFNSELICRFGDKYAKLRDIFSDKEENA